MSPEKERELIRVQLEQKYGLTNHPKRMQVFEIAYGAEDDIEDLYAQLVKLLEP